MSFYGRGCWSGACSFRLQHGSIAHLLSYTQMDFWRNMLMARSDEVRRKTRKGRVGKEVKRERDASEAHLASRRQSASAAGAAAWRRRRREMNPTKLFFSRLCEKCHIVCNGRFHIYKRRFDSASSALDGSPECRQLSLLSSPCRRQQHYIYI